MATIKQIQFKRTKKPGVKPLPDQLAEGELALNLADRTLFTHFDGNIIDLGFAKGGTVDGNINQISGNFSTKGSITASGDVTAKTGNFDYTLRINRVDGANPGKLLAIQSDGTSTNDMLIQHWGNGATRESVLEFKFGTSASHPSSKMGMMLQRFTDNNIGFDVNGYANIATSVVAGTYVKAGGENGVITTAFTGGAAPIRSFQIGNFSSATYENAIQFTDGTTWLGEIGTRKALRPSNQTKTEFKVNGNITSIGNSESFRLIYQDYGTFWRNDGNSLYLMQTAKGDQDGSFSSLRPFRLNLESGDISLHTTTIQNQPGKNWIGIGATVTPNADQLGVAGLGTFVAVGDSDTGIGQRGDGNLDLLANNVAALKLTSSRVLTTRAFTAQVQDSTGKIVMPANNNAILTVDGSGEPNQATNGVTLLCYNSGDKYHHYFRGNGNFVVNMPYATFDKDAYFGGYVNAAQINSRGSINTTTVPQATYKWDDLNNAAANGAKSYLRRWRSQGNAIIWHETCTQSDVVISTGATDSSPVWGYSTGGIWTNGSLNAQQAMLVGIGGGNSLLKLGNTTDPANKVMITGEANGLVHGKVQGGAWVNWRQRPAGLLLSLDTPDSAHNIWKATRWGSAHVAAMQVLTNTANTSANCKLQVMDMNYDFTNAGFSTPTSAYFGGDISTGSSLRASGSVYWGPNGAWAAADGNIYGTQWGEGGTAAWMGGNVAKLWGNQAFRANVTAQVFQANGNSIYIQGTGNRHLWFRNAGGTEKGLIYNDDNGNMMIRANINRTWTFSATGALSAPGDITAGAWMYATEFYLNSDRRLKDNIRDIESVSDKLHKIDIKRYSMKNGSNDDAIGVIAQQVQDVFPELVSEQEDGMLTVNYRGLSTVLWKIVQEQDVKLQSIEERLAKIGA